MDGLKMLYPPTPSQGGVEDDAEAAQRLHRALNARPARRGCREAEARGGAAAKGKKEQEAGVKEEEEVKISALELAVKDEPEEDVKIRELEYGGEGGQRRGVKREREEDIVVEAGPSGRGAGGRQQAGHSGRGASRFRGVTKEKSKIKPWRAQIYVTVDGKRRQIHIGNFAREEDAVRAFDRVNIAKLGHAKAKTNFPVVKYRAEWVQLEAVGVEGAVARERQQTRQD